MLEPVLEVLDPRPGATIVDGTVGAGGHSEAIARKLAGQGQLIAIDRDPEMLELAAKRLSPFGETVRLVHVRLSHLRDSVSGAGLAPVDGILLDLGICSAQLDDFDRGFAFRRAGSSAPLDMRMNRQRGPSAAELLESIDDARLAEILREGGVARPRTVARAICARRPLRIVGDLVEAIESARLPPRKHHPATLVFQALRIAVNDEYDELERGLEAAIDLLAPGGRLVVLSYHSGEDRRVKGFLAREARGCICPPDLPVCGCGRRPRIRIIARGAGPSEEEARANPRARSARLRAGERV
jgi:16S rRNA (cytosine1402-N4)-methyltransferase